MAKGLATTNRFFASSKTASRCAMISSSLAQADPHIYLIENGNLSMRENLVMTSPSVRPSVHTFFPLPPRGFCPLLFQTEQVLFTRSRDIMALDHSRLDLENKFLGNQPGRIFLRSTGLLYKILPFRNQPFILFIHHIWGETVLFIVQTSDRMLYFTTFQDKLRSVNIQDDQKPW